ncbi:MAG: hypothetical protein JWP93_2237 [Polaromonas sp.]|nr:hypothetical protein [Polaromonas sp.]
MGAGSGLADVELLGRAGEVLFLGDRNEGPELDEIYLHGACLLSRRMGDLQTAMVTLNMARLRPVWSQCQDRSGWGWHGRYAYCRALPAYECPAFGASYSGSFFKLAHRVPKKTMDPVRPASYTASTPRNLAPR